MRGYRAARRPATRKWPGCISGPESMWQGNPFGSVGSGTWAASTYWYLLSPDGRVQRGYRLPHAPNGDIARFDCEAARREAPADGGSYMVEGARLTLVMGMETLVAERTPAGHLLIGGSLFQRSIQPNR